MITTPTDSERQLEMARAAQQIKFMLGSALQFEMDETPKGVPTITIQQAPIIMVEKVRQGNWSQKVQFQLNPTTELITLIHTMTQKIRVGTEVKFDFHGRENNKSLTLKMNPDGSLYLGLREGQAKNSYSILPPSGVAQVLTLAYKVYAWRFQIRVIDAISILNVSPIAEVPGNKQATRGAA